MNNITTDHVLFLFICYDNENLKRTLIIIIPSLSVAFSLCVLQSL